MRAPESAPVADGADSLVFSRAIPREPAALRATMQPGPADQGTSGELSRVACYPVAPYDEVGRRGGAATLGVLFDIQERNRRTGVDCARQLAIPPLCLCLFDCDTPQLQYVSILGERGILYLQ